MSNISTLKDVCATLDAKLEVTDTSIAIATISPSTRGTEAPEALLLTYTLDRYETIDSMYAWATGTVRKLIEIDQDRIRRLMYKDKQARMNLILDEENAGLSYSIFNKIA